MSDVPTDVFWLLLSLIGFGPGNAVQAFSFHDRYMCSGMNTGSGPPSWGFTSSNGPVMGVGPFCNKPQKFLLALKRILGWLWYQPDQKVCSKTQTMKLLFYELLLTHCEIKQIWMMVKKY